ncbi:MAG TPA: wax ester/triacylglycerol synthase family O-acyltransferase [Motilibacterales bacterium]|nr:wax ester/triacylglycerol synthase family O-acyltransferase [Motilibacterales bacterium]
MADRADRLHAIDLVWLEMQGDGPPIAIGTVAVAEGPAPADGELLSMVADRLDRMPRLHQDLTDRGVGLRRPLWVEAQEVDLPAHLHHVDATAAGDHPGLDAAVGRIMEQSLPPDQPLWDMWVVDGLEDRWALVWRIHHTIADGVGALILLGHGFDLAVDGGGTLADAVLANQPAQPDGLAGEPTVAPREGPLSLTALASEVGHSLDGVLSVLRGAAPHVIPAVTALIPHPPSHLAGEVGPRRMWVSVDLPLVGVKSTGRALGASVNDIVLACVAGGFRDLLIHRGEPVSGRVVRNLVPVSMRAPGDDSSQNRVSGTLGHLPVGIADPVARLAEVRAGVAHGRGFGTPALASALLGLVDRSVPASVQDVAIAMVGRTAPAWFLDTLTTNVPGPQFPVYLCGRRVVAMYPVIPVAGHTCITTGIFSYDGTLNVGVTGDADQAGDIDVLARGISRAAAELAERARQIDDAGQPER